MAVSLLNLPKTVRTKVTARHGFVAADGWLNLSLDYSSQELYIAAILSGDQNMLNSFLPNEQLADYIPVLTANGSILMKDGKPVMVKNPQKDMHTLTAATCILPELFNGRPDYEWVTIANDESLTSMPGCIRDPAKRLLISRLLG
jgi:hypothetical protein